MNTFLFDLDGTLLSIDMNKFEEIYFAAVKKSFPEKENIVTDLLLSTKTMIMNKENITNKEVFMNDFSERTGLQADFFMDRFNTLYATQFDKIQEAIVHEKPLRESVKLLKKKGYRLVLATNPLFLIEATRKRIVWAGLNIEDFDHITTLEESHYFKPHLEYYKEILEHIDAQPEDCIMVGNDVSEDLVAKKLGLKTYLITDHMLNKNNLEIVTDHQGNYEDFRKYIERLPNIK